MWKTMCKKFLHIVFHIKKWIHILSCAICLTLKKTTMMNDYVN